MARVGKLATQLFSYLTKEAIEKLEQQLGPEYLAAKKQQQLEAQSLIPPEPPVFEKRVYVKIIDSGEF
jgi:hypothetical protein